ncbi:MAG: GDSL-type esterase/lipase family protein [Clostridia bacterium]
MKRKIVTFCALALVLCMALGFVACKGNDPQNTAYDLVKQTKSDNFALLNQTATQGQVVMIGDSIVEIFPTELFENNSLNVYNRGISGDTSDRMLERLESNALSAKPKILSILVGTNDYGRGLSQDALVDNIKKCIAKAKDSGVEKVIVQAIYPVNHGFKVAMVGGRSNKDIAAINTKLQDMCAKNGGEYVDMFTPLQDSEGEFKKELTYDGLHPNAAGFKVIADILRPFFVA